MATKIIYDGSLGPKTVSVGRIRFVKDAEVTVNDDKLAELILKKKGFSKAKAANAAKE